MIRGYRPRWEVAAYGRFARDRSSTRFLAGGYYLGLGEYLLLSAVPRHRLPSRDRDRLGVLSRNFGPAAQLLKRKRRRGNVASFTSSDVGPHAERLSPAAWGRLARIPQGRRTVLRQLAARDGVRSRPDFRSQSLTAVLQRRPDEIGPVLQHLRRDVEPEYVRAALSAAWQVAQKGLDPDAEARLVGHVEAFYFGLSPELRAEPQVNREFCSVVRATAEAAWGVRVEERLAELAGDLEPREGEFPPFVDADLDNRNDLDTCAVNSVRGSATLAAAALLYRRPRSPDLAQLAELAASDPHPAVRAAAHHVALPMLNVDPATAVEFACRVNDHAEDLVLASHAFDDLLSYTLADPQHRRRLTPAVARMVRSHRPGAAEAGAAWATLTLLHFGEMGDLVELALAGSPRQRVRVVQIAGRHADEPNPAAAADLIARLFDDPDATVRDAVATSVAGAKPLGKALPLLQRYVASPAFEDRSVGRVLRALDDEQGPLLPAAEVLLAIGSRLASGAGGSGHSASSLSRLHAEADEAGDDLIATRCLDAIDAVILAGRVHDVFGAADAS